MSAQPIPSERWTRAALAELEAIAPIRVKRIAGELRVFPDLASCYPSRIVTRDEARARGWPCYFEGAVCSRNHLAPRFVANGGCVDCRREKAGRALVGIKLAPPEEGAKKLGDLKLVGLLHPAQNGDSTRSFNVPIYASRHLIVEQQPT